MTYYDILGVPHDATPEQIKQAYRLQIRFFHPDLFEGSPDVADIKTKQLNEAYGVLGNPELRSQYDRILKSNMQSPPKQEPHPDNQAYAYTRTTPPPQYTNTGRTYNPSQEAEDRRKSNFDAHLYEEKEKLKKQEKQRTRKAIFKLFVVVILISLFVGFLHLNLADSEETLEPIDRPTTGKILAGQECWGESKIEVTASNNYDCVVSLKTIQGTNRVSFYVRAGETVTVGVPAEHLYVYFASGEEWYGYGEGLMFGKNTVFSKDDELLDFTGGQWWAYTLYPVTDGNFSETPSDENEFFG